MILAYLAADMHIQGSALQSVIKITFLGYFDFITLLSPN
jgi:hypothetical protein